MNHFNKQGCTPGSPPSRSPPPFLSHRLGISPPPGWRILNQGKCTIIQSLVDQVLFFEPVFLVDKVLDDGVDHLKDDVGVHFLPLSNRGDTFKVSQYLLQSCDLRNFNCSFIISLAVLSLMPLFFNIFSFIIFSLIWSSLYRSSLSSFWWIWNMLSSQTSLGISRQLISSSLPLSSKSLILLQQSRTIDRYRLQFILRISLLLFRIYLVNLKYSSFIISRLPQQILLMSWNVRLVAPCSWRVFIILVISALLSKKRSSEVFRSSSLEVDDLAGVRGGGGGTASRVYLRDLIRQQQRLPANRSPKAVKPSSHLQLQRDYVTDYAIYYQPTINYSLSLLKFYESSLQNLVITNMLYYLLTYLLVPILHCLTDETLDTGSIEIFNLSLSSRTFMRPVRCQGFFVSSQSLPVNITLQSQSKTLIFISDRKYTQCNDDIFKACEKSSKLCIQSQIQGQSSYYMNQCIQNFYVYLYLEQYKGGFVSVEENQNANCNANPINPNIPTTSCSNIPFNECGVRGSTCNLGCYRLECSFNDAKSRRQNTAMFCVNSSVQSKDWDNVCQEDREFKQGRNKKAVGYYCNKNPVVVNMEESQGEESILWELIEWMFWLAVIGFLGSIIYYRYMLSKTGRPPFTPPEWMPEMIFPRPARVGQGDPLENYRQI